MSVENVNFFTIPQIFFYFYGTYSVCQNCVRGYTELALVTLILYLKQERQAF